jgi:hypothetical protein
VEEPVKEDAPAEAASSRWRRETPRAGATCVPRHRLPPVGTWNLRLASAGAAGLDVVAVQFPSHRFVIDGAGIFRSKNESSAMWRSRRSPCATPGKGNGGSMLPFWRRVRLIATTTTSVISVGLLVLACALLGRFPDVTVQTLAIIALPLPGGCLFLTTVIGWHRSAVRGAEPRGVIGWIIRSHLVPLLPLLFVVFLVGLGRQIDLTPLDLTNEFAAISDK